MDNAKRFPALERSHIMRKTKIVCTLGPATDREGVLRDMMLSGMNVARFNFSHGTHPEHKARLDAVKALREELHLPVAAMLDTKGPEVRLRSFKNGAVELTAGQEFTLTTEDVEGDETRCAITYAALPQDVSAGNSILLDDGLVRLTVLETTAKTIRCRVENSGAMKNHKGVNVPGVSLSMPYMSQQDKDDILFGVEQGFDFIAASFVRCAADIRDIRLSDLRGLCGLVTQESLLFNDTIRNNLLLGKPDATDQEILQAAQVANAMEFIERLPEGFDTNIGDAGLRLSGGQRQRLCIARAVLKNAPILLLDEATSALDTESEKLVQNALENLMSAHTSFVVAHRLSTIQNADLIVVMSQGRIIEQGTHEQLLALGGMYAKLIHMQSFEN